MNEKIKRLSTNVSDLLPDNPKDPQDVYDSFSLLYNNQSEYFRNLGPDNIIKLVFYIYSLKETGNFKMGDDMINNLAFASLFTTNGNYKNEECPECDGSGVIPCHNCTQGLIDCDECGGRGEDSENDTCGVCDGDGEVYCDECGGDGDLQCDFCDGLGEITSDRLELLHYYICTWSNQVKTSCELEERTKEPAMSEYDFDRLRGNHYLVLYYDERDLEFKTFVEINQMYCLSYDDEPRLLIARNNLIIHWDDSDSFDYYRV